MIIITIIIFVVVVVVVVGVVVMKIIFETKLYSRNLIKGINIWAVPLKKYTEPFLK